MDPFSPAHQTDEGYSEDPFTLSMHQNLAMAEPSFKSPADLPAWLARTASALPLSIKMDMTMALLEQLPTSVLADIVQRLRPRLYLDFIQHLPPEICLKILGYLDPISLVCVMQTCRAWYKLVMDPKLWERLYHLEGWKAIQSEIDIWEARVNQGLHKSIGHLRRLHNADTTPGDLDSLVNDDDDDLEMVDVDCCESGTANHTASVGDSIFGNPKLPLSPRSAGPKPQESVASLGGVLEKGKGVDRGSRPLERRVRAKRKATDSSLQHTSSHALRGNSPDNFLRSTLWMWDASRSRYRINWKHLYNMRQRLESNWELGKYTTFQLPHPLYPEEGHQECIYTLQFDANYLVSGSRDQSLRIWDMHSHRLVRPPLLGHKGSVLCLQFDSDPTEDILVSGSSDSNIFIWKFSTGQVVQKITDAHRESVLNVRFDKRILVTSSKDKSVKIFTRRPFRPEDPGSGSGVDQARVNPVPVTLKRYGVEPEIGQELLPQQPFRLIGRLDGHGAAVNAIQVRDCTVVSVSGDRQIKIWNWPEQVCTRTIPAHDKGIACVEFDERRIVSGSSDFEVCIFDAPTGLKVAQLRGHTNLVRTVQAGFGDLPNSREEDEAEAKAVDAEYFRAIEAGEVNQDNDRRARRARPVNAGSSRPTEIQAFGAKVPPGGGGSRKYGRIVSGSYDHTIIIWRRDKEGVWKPAHHFRQEEAAVAAQRRVARPQAPSASESSSEPHFAQVNAALSSLSAPGLGGSQEKTAANSSGEGTGASHASPGLHVALIEQVVPLGATALEQALLSYPGALAYHGVLLNAIEREPSPVVRAQLRQAVANALVVVEASQAARARQNSGQYSAFMPSSVMTAAATATATATTDGPSSWRNAVGPGSTVAEASAPIKGLEAMATPAPHAAPVPAPAQPAQHRTLLNPTQEQLPAQEQSNVHATRHHPHLVAPENSAARIFKLQFDARKIICCSQASVIVGWDFCNEEAELEAASRFFATVD
ncbi:hypothetical protein CDD82_6426 [Ophiocordyceps australis]|uniref:F-box domain-containing protein n=1 Tax=Ophiocordyceps australis TaxID=1399860 RepID=A0A2C5YS58_9HYPO|nr:hypothetical protein CDD82_6426 [Ophiocordyceps australis]